MKKLLALFLILILATGCAGCAKQPEPETAAPAPAAEPEAPDAETGAPAAEQDPPAETPAAGRMEGPGYDTPEEAVLAYIDAMNRGDVGGMLSTFAIETYADHAAPELWLRYSHNVTVYDLFKSVPITDEFSRSLLAVNRRESIERSLKTSYALYGAGDYYPDHMRLSSAEEVRGLAEEFRRSPLHEPAGNVTFAGWISPVSLTGGLIAKPQVGRDFIESLAYTGADDFTELVAELRVNGAVALQPMTCACYGGRWYNLDFSTRSAGLSKVWDQSAWKRTFWLPGTDPDEPDFLRLFPTDYPEETARWDALQQSDRAGARWPMTSLNASDVALYDTAEAAESSEGAGVWAEMHFTRVGGAMITFRVSPSLQQQLGMDSSAGRICFYWSPDGIPTSYTQFMGMKKKQAEIPLFRFFGINETEPFSLDGISAVLDDTTVTVTLADGLQAVFEKPSAARDSQPGSAVSGSPAPAAGARLEGDGFGSPEEAVLAYLEAMNRGDVPGMLSTFALETWAEHADPLFYIEMLGAFSPDKNDCLPCSDDYGRSLVACARAGSLSRSLLSAWVSYAGDFIQNIPLRTNDEIPAVLDQFRNSPLSSIAGNVSFTGWLDPLSATKGFLASPQYGATTVSDMILSGADDEALVTAQFTVCGYPAVLPMRCVRYGDRWYNDSPGGLVADMHTSSESCQRTFLWLPAAEEQSGLSEAASFVTPEHRALWDAVRQSGLGGTRWRLTAASLADVTVYDDPAAAENDAGPGISAEIRLNGIGGGFVTVTASPAVRKSYGMDSSVRRITFGWQPGESDNLLFTPRGVFPRSENRVYRDITAGAVLNGDTLTVTFPDGARAVFEKTE